MTIIYLLKLEKFAAKHADSNKKFKRMEDCNRTFKMD